MTSMVAVPRIVQSYSKRKILDIHYGVTNNISYNVSLTAEQQMLVINLVLTWWDYDQKRRKMKYESLIVSHYTLLPLLDFCVVL